MKKTFINHTRSKALISALLLCFFAPSSVKALSDTIIIDQTTLIVQRIVEVDTLGQEEEPNNTSWWEKQDKILGFFPEVGLTRSSLNKSNSKSVNELTGNATRSGALIGFGSRFELEIKPDWWLFTGIHFNRANYQNRIFDDQRLDDSLAFFQSFGENELSQILELRYEIGGISVLENDTIDLAINRNDLVLSSIHVPLGVRYQKPYYNRKTKWTWDIGLALVYGRQVAVEQPSMLFLDEPKTIAFIEAETYLAKSNWLNGQVQFGAVRRNSNDSFAYSIRYVGETPSLLVDSSAQNFTWTTWSSRIQFGFNIFL